MTDCGLKKHRKNNNFLLFEHDILCSTQEQMIDLNLKLHQAKKIKTFQHYNTGKGMHRSKSDDILLTLWSDEPKTTTKKV